MIRIKGRDFQRNAKFWKIQFFGYPMQIQGMAADINLTRADLKVKQINAALSIGGVIKTAITMNNISSGPTPHRNRRGQYPRSIGRISVCKSPAKKPDNMRTGK